MEKIKKQAINSNCIRKTAYKALLLLKILINNPLTNEQIIKLLNENVLFDVNVNTSSLRYLTKSLKKIGCKIEEPSFINNYRKILKNNPFFIDLSEEEVNLLNKFRKNPYEKASWKEILDTNSLINKLYLVVNKNNTTKKLINNDIFSKINPDIIMQLNKYCQDRKTVAIGYSSGFRYSNLELITSFLKYEKDKLYLWGFSPLFQELSYLRVDKIKKITPYPGVSPRIVNRNLIRYLVFDKNYKLEDNDFFVKETEDGLLIDYKVENSFKAVQKFLELGDKCKILAPERFRNEFLEIVKSMHKRYLNNDSK